MIGVAKVLIIILNWRMIYDFCEIAINFIEMRCHVVGLRF